MTRSSEADSLDRWTAAINIALPRTDDELVEFLATQIVMSGFHPETNDDSGSSAERASESSHDLDDTLQSLLEEHLVFLLEKDPQETTFISRDILDAYWHVTATSSSDSTDPRHLRPPPRPDTCELCDRSAFLTIHHLFPRSEHAYVLAHPPVDIGVDKQSLLTTHIAYLCRPCHSAVHRVADNRHLAQELFTVARLLEKPEIVKFVGYQSKQKTSRVNHAKFGLRYKQ